MTARRSFTERVTVNFAITSAQQRAITPPERAFKPGAVEIICRPVFYFDFMPVHLAYFEAMALAHYDSRCKCAALPGGFIYGWKHTLAWEESQDQQLLPCQASTDQLDTLMKICENMAVLGGSFKIAEVSQLRQIMHDAWTCAQDHYGKLFIKIGAPT